MLRDMGRPLRPRARRGASGGARLCRPCPRARPGRRAGAPARFSLFTPGRRTPAMYRGPPSEAMRRVTSLAAPPRRRTPRLPLTLERGTTGLFRGLEVSPPRWLATRVTPCRRAVVAVGGHDSLDDIRPLFQGKSTGPYSTSMTIKPAWRHPLARTCAGEIEQGPPGALSVTTNELNPEEYVPGGTYMLSRERVPPPGPDVTFPPPMPRWNIHSITATTSREAAPPAAQNRLHTGRPTAWSNAGAGGGGGRSP